MKEGWTYKKLGEVCEVISGQSPDGKSYNNEGKGTPFYQGKKEFTIKYIGNPTTWTSEETKIAMKDDILMSVRAPVGDINFATQRVCIGRGLAAIRPNTLIDKDYLFYFLLSEKNNIKGKEGAVFPSINRKEIMDISISYPIFSEQQRIVSRLDSAFAHIDERKANAEKQLSEARALFQQALTKAMEPKEGWEEKKLEDLCTDIVDCPHSTPRKVDHPTKYPCIRTSELKGGKIEWESMQYLDEDEYIVRTARIKPQPNDIVYGREGTYGDAVLLPEGYYFSLGQRTMLFRPDVRCVEPKYLHYNVISSHVYEQAKAKNSGCGVGHVNVKDIKVFKIGVPPLSKQQRIVSRLDSLSAHVRELEEVLQKTISECDALKQALLRQVFE